jgi:uncharacterized membrane protein YfcA
MHMELSTIALLGVAFFTAGFIDSIAGGGGLITMPALLLAGLPPQVALATNKGAISPGTVVSVIIFVRKKITSLHVFAFGFIFSILGAKLGARLVLTISQEAFFYFMMAVIPLAIGALLFPMRRSGLDMKSIPLQRLAMVVPAVAFVVGIYDGFFGPGTGTFLIILFSLLLRANLLSASANARVLNFGSNLGSLYIFIQSDIILYSLAAPLAACNMAGNFLGSRTAIKRGDHFVRKLLIAVVMGLLATLVVKFVY